VDSAKECSTEGRRVSGRDGGKRAKISFRPERFIGMEMIQEIEARGGIVLKMQRQVQDNAIEISIGNAGFACRGSAAARRGD
jgi:hypothetical protein